MPSKKGRPGFVHRGISVALGSDGRLHGKVRVGRLPNGKPDRRHVAAPADNPAAIKADIDRLLDAKVTGTVPKPGKSSTVQEWVTTWLTDIAPYGARPLRPTTLAGYWSLARNWIFVHLGGLRLDELERDTDPLDKMYAAMHRAGLARTSVLKCHAVLRRALSVAEQRGKIGRNPAKRIDNPGSTKPRRRPRSLSREQAERVLSVIDNLPDRRDRLRWKVGIAIGPRQGEALGLRWSYFDLTEGTVALDWQLQRLTYRHGCPDAAACVAEHALCKPRRACRPRYKHGCDDAETCTKNRTDLCPKRVEIPRSCTQHRRQPCAPAHRAGCTEHAARCPAKVGGLTIVRAKTADPHEPDEDDAYEDDEDADVEDAVHLVALPATLVAEARTHKAEQTALRLRLGKLWHDNDLVFCQLDGRPIDPGTDYRQFREILAKAGLKVAGTHAGRRTAATLMLELGEDLAVIQEVLGHTDIRMTRGYTRVSVGMTRNAAERMDEALFGGAPVTNIVTKRGQRRSS